MRIAHLIGLHRFQADRKGLLIIIVQERKVCVLN
jgi:hypothetical protein